MIKKKEFLFDIKLTNLQFETNYHNTKDFNIDRHVHSPSSTTNNSSSSSTHSLQRLPEYTAYLNSDTDILDSSSSNPSPSAPYTPDRVPTTPTNTPITQTQTLAITTQPQPILQNLTFAGTSSPVSDSNDETFTTPNTQDTLNILNRPPLPPITTTRSVHIPDPSSVLQYINSSPHKVPTATKTKKTPLPTLPQDLNLPSSSHPPITSLPEPSLKAPVKKSKQHPFPSPSELRSFTFSQIYPKLELEPVHSTTTSSLTDLYPKDKDSDSTASTRVPRHNYIFRSQQQRNSQELQSSTSSSTNSRLLRQQNSFTYITTRP